MSTFPHNLILRLGLKAFGGSEFGGYAPLPAPAAEVRTDGRRMRVYGRCTSEKVDRSREVVVARGVDWDEYRNNPICTINHGWREPEKLIGHARIDNQFTPKLSDDGTGWDFGCQFIQQGPQAGRAAEAFALVDTGVLRGVSLGFRFLGAHSQQITADDGQPALRIDRCSPFEITFLPVPDNPDAVVHVVEKGVNGRRLSQHWLDLLRPMVPKVRLHGFTPKKREKAMGDGGWKAESSVSDDGKEHYTIHSLGSGGSHLMVGHYSNHWRGQLPFNLWHADGPRQRNVSGPSVPQVHPTQQVHLHDAGGSAGDVHLHINPDGHTRIDRQVMQPDGRMAVRTHKVEPASQELRAMIANHHQNHAWMPLLDKIAEEYPDHTSAAIDAHTASRRQYGERTKGMKPMAQPMPDPAAQPADPMQQQQPQQPPSPASQLPQVKPSIALLMAAEQYTMGFIKFLKQQGDVQDHPEVKKLIGGMILHLSQAYRALSKTHQQIQSEDPTFPNLLGHGGLVAPDPAPPMPGATDAGAVDPTAAGGPGFGDGLDDVTGPEINAGMEGMDASAPMTDSGGPAAGTLTDDELNGLGDDGQTGPAPYGDVGDEDQFSDDALGHTEPDGDEGVGGYGDGDGDEGDEDEDEDSPPPVAKRKKGYEPREDMIVLVREKGMPVAFERARRLLDAYESAFKREFQGTDLNVLRWAADNVDVATPLQVQQFKQWCRHKSLDGIVPKAAPAQPAVKPAMGTPEYQAEVEREIARLLAERQKQQQG